MRKQVTITRISKNQVIKPGQSYRSDGKNYTVDFYDPLTGDLVLFLMMTTDGIDRSQDHSHNYNNYNPVEAEVSESSNSSNSHSHDSGGLSSHDDSGGGGSD